MDLLILLTNVTILVAGVKVVLQTLLNIYVATQQLYRGIPSHRPLLLFQAESWRRHRRPLIPRTTNSWHQKDRQSFLIEMRGVYTLVYATAILLPTCIAPLLLIKILTNVFQMGIGQVASITLVYTLTSLALLAKNDLAVRTTSSELAMRLTGIPPAKEHDPSAPNDRGPSDPEKPGQ